MILPLPNAKGMPNKWLEINDQKLQVTIGLAKCGLDNTQHQLLFCYCAIVIRATELYSSKILS